MCHKNGNSTKKYAEGSKHHLPESLHTSICQIHKVQLGNSNLKSPIPVPIHKYIYILTYTDLYKSQENTLFLISTYSHVIFTICCTRNNALEHKGLTEISECGKDFTSLGQNLKGMGQRKQHVVEGHQIAAPLTETSFTSLSSCLWHNNSTSRYSPNRWISYFAQYRSHLRTLCEQSLELHIQSVYVQVHMEKSDPTNLHQ